MDIIVVTCVCIGTTYHNIITVVNEICTSMNSFGIFYKKSEFWLLLAFQVSMGLMVTIVSA